MRWWQVTLSKYCWLKQNILPSLTSSCWATPTRARQPALNSLYRVNNWASCFFLTMWKRGVQKFNNNMIDSLRSPEFFYMHCSLYIARGFETRAIATTWEAIVQHHFIMCVTVWKVHLQVCIALQCLFCFFFGGIYGRVKRKYFFDNVSGGNYPEWARERKTKRGPAKRDDWRWSPT